MVLPTVMLAAMTLMMLNKTLLLELELLSPGASPMKLLIILNPWGVLFASTVIFISANVLKFSSSYMVSDPFLNRFIILVLLFVLSMIFLIFIPHMIALLLGWDGLGLISFCLVIYYQNPKSLAAGMITALTNRVGDVLILIVIALLLNQGHWTIINTWTDHTAQLVTLFLLLAAMTKSAQVPFSSWLPAAMAAPTPVSALVHSSTLVTAGIFLLIRFYPFLSTTPWFCPLSLMLASLTMLMAGISATAETDLKKIIALSTLSQLGVMMTSLGLGLQTLALFHLLTHAMFKALLFLTAGNIIHLHLHNQDLRTTGNLVNQMPLTLACMLAANIALTGLPFLSGFYSKDMILEYSMHWPFSASIIFIAMTATAITSLYSVRYMASVTWSPSHQTPMHQIHDKDSNMSTPMILLTTGAIAGGAVLNWALLSPHLHPSLPENLKALPLLMTVSGLFLAWTMNTSHTTAVSPAVEAPTLHWHTATMWFLTPLSTQATLSLPYWAAKTLTTTMDQGWWEKATGKGTFATLQTLTHSLTALEAHPSDSSSSGRINLIFTCLNIFTMTSPTTF
uniref:NADH-ubiquinone oxidoreductase chain 5 n=1 Tax=Sipunculus nudus TaxID=6446 RepID=B8XR45_SIPNU|nr:NADH dehydrogenase subunit 5 [Sipunculus nudus]ACJ11902.1 NADH dehydrogenase subunit 5 [Sipunculus nudus]